MLVLSFQMTLWGRSLRPSHRRTSPAGSDSVDVIGGTQKPQMDESLDGPYRQETETDANESSRSVGQLPVNHFVVVSFSRLAIFCSF